jgi:hypothetical protein
VELTAGGTLGRYRLLERAGAGGMAEVWKAVQPSLDRFVAIKVLPRHLAGEPGYLERFQREARAISRLDHPNILGIHDFGEDNGYTYMVMPFLAGGTLSRNLGRPWSVQAAVRILEPLAAALDYAHARGIIHRDVKPSNVLIGEGGRVVLADFGIARMTEASLTLSGGGALVGTPAYMSPEQVQGVPASPASDQYSIGIVAYEMLTGRRPFEAETPLAVALAHVHQPLPPPRSINAAIPPDAERVLFKALAKQPDDRVSTVSAFVAALADAQRNTPLPPVGAPQAGSTRLAPLQMGSSPLVRARSEPAPAETDDATIQPDLFSAADADSGIHAPSPALVPVRRTGTMIALGAVGLAVILIGSGLLGLPGYLQGAASPAGPAPVVGAPPDQQSPTPPVTGKRGRIGETPRGVLLYTEPGLSGRFVKTLPAGTPVEILGPERVLTSGGHPRTWWQVRDGDGATGWVATTDVVVDSPGR